MVWPAAGGASQRLLLGLDKTVIDLQRPTVFAGPPVLDHRSNPASSDSHAGYKAFRLAADGRWLEFRAVAR